ncbi:MAG: SRPBCC family protein [Solirubrobacteraceae bacterium]
MTQTHAVLEMEPLGIRVEVRRTAEETNGELFEMDVIGRPRAFFAQRHIHPHQAERLEMISGAMKVTMGGREHIVNEGESIEIPPGTPHTQVPVGEGAGQVRIQVRPAGRSQAFLEHLAHLCREGKISRLGFPLPRAAAQLILDYADAGHAATPPLSVQRAIARALLAFGGPARPYQFVDEWDVAAPPEAVFAAIADARTYPQWWRPVYIDVEADGEPRVGAVSTQHFKGRLPYHLRTRSVIAAIDAPRTITAEVDGDLRGRGTWTLTQNDAGTQVRFDWRVYADRKLLRALTPILRPALAANHNWAIARAIDGLGPYARLWATHDQNYDHPRAAESGNGAGGGHVRSRDRAGLGGGR